MGSYSIEATFAGMSYLLRLKSIILYLLRFPPPICLTVILPLKFLPPVFCLGASRLFSGLVVVISSNMETDMKRRAGLVGLYLLIAIIPFPPD